MAPMVPVVPGVQAARVRCHRGLLPCVPQSRRLTAQPTQRPPGTPPLLIPRVPRAAAQPPLRVTAPHLSQEVATLRAVGPAHPHGALLFGASHDPHPFAGTLGSHRLAGAPPPAAPPPGTESSEYASSRTGRQGCVPQAGEWRLRRSARGLRECRAACGRSTEDADRVRACGRRRS
jgi:hypothetical protein